MAGPSQPPSNPEGMVGDAINSAAETSSGTVDDVPTMPEPSAEPATGALIGLEEPPMFDAFGDELTNTDNDVVAAGDDDADLDDFLGGAL